MMIRNRKYALMTLGLILGSTTPGWGVEVPVGRGRVEVSLGAQVDYDSNIYLNSSEISDTTAVINGMAKYVHDTGIVTAYLSVGTSGQLYSDHSSLNTFDPTFTGSLTATPSDKTALGASLSVARSTLANEALNDRTTSNNVSLSGRMQHLWSEKLGYRLNGTYNNSNYRTSGYSDVLSASFGVDGVYTYSPKLLFLAGFNYRESWTDNRPANQADVSSKDYRYSVGAEGSLTAKVTGSVSVGVVQRKFNASGFNDGNALFLASSLRWAAGQKTTYSLSASQDFDVTAASQSSKNSRVSLAMLHALTQKTSWEGSVGFGRSDYQGHTGVGSRRDDSFDAKTQLNFGLTDRTDAHLALGYRNVDSDLAISTYSRVYASVGASVKF